jgi:hypothetical protein
VREDVDGGHEDEVDAPVEDLDEVAKAGRMRFIEVLDHFCGHCFFDFLKYFRQKLCFISKCCFYLP